MAHNCPICRDALVVELAGTHPDGYSRGSAPCRWCEPGRKLHARLATQKHHPLGDYSAHSIIEPPAEGRYRVVSREEALNEWATCQHSWQKLGEPKARPWAKDMIHFERCTRCGKEEARTQKLGPTIRGDA